MNVITLNCLLSWPQQTAGKKPDPSLCENNCVQLCCCVGLRVAASICLQRAMLPANIISDDSSHFLGNTPAIHYFKLSIYTSIGDLVTESLTEPLLMFNIKESCDL